MRSDYTYHEVLDLRHCVPCNDGEIMFTTYSINFLILYMPVILIDLVYMIDFYNFDYDGGIPVWFKYCPAKDYALQGSIK